MSVKTKVTICKPGSDFHGMTGEVIRVVGSLNLCEVHFYCQKMNPETRTLQTKWGAYVGEWRGGSWMFTMAEVITA